MSIKAKIIKLGIRLTPKGLVIWVTNHVLKGIASLGDYHFDLDGRKAYARVQLCGEPEAIEVWLEDFAVLKEAESYRFLLREARSNRVWLSNILSRVTNKAWVIPQVPQLAGHMGLVEELLKANAPVNH